MSRDLVRLLLLSVLACLAAGCTHYAGVLRKYEAVVPVAGSEQIPPGTPTELKATFERPGDGTLRGKAEAHVPGTMEVDIQQHAVEAVNRYEFFGATLWRAFAAPVHIAVLAPLWHPKICDYGDDGHVGAGDRLRNLVNVLNPLMAWPIDDPEAGADEVVASRRERRAAAVALPLDLELVLTSGRGKVTLTAPVDAEGKFAIALFPTVESVWDHDMLGELRDRRSGGACPVPGLAGEVAAYLSKVGRLEQLEWDLACAVDTRAAYESFRSRYHEARWETAVRERQQESDWRAAVAAGDRQALVAFVRAWLGGPHSAEAAVRIEELDWQDAARVDTAHAFELFLAEHADGTRADAAKRRRDELQIVEQWRRAQRIDTDAVYRQFLDDHPDAPTAAACKQRLDALARETDGWDAVCRSGTEPAFRAYLAANPGAAHAPAAERALQDLAGRDIVDLIEEGKVEVRTAGNDIQQIRVELRRTAPYPLRVRVPAGSYFVAGNSNAQNMVATGDYVADLATTEWQEVWVGAACASQPKHVPGADDTFTIERPQHQAELARLLPHLAAAKADTGTRQAAVWIVTDDATYNSLGTLVRGYAGSSFGGTRVIGPTEAVRALQLCQEAGIGINGKRLLDDQKELLPQLPDGELKTWFAALKPAPRKAQPWK